MTTISRRDIRWIQIQRYVGRFKCHQPLEDFFTFPGSNRVDSKRQSITTKATGKSVASTLATVVTTGTILCKRAAVVPLREKIFQDDTSDWHSCQALRRFLRRDRATKNDSASHRCHVPIGDGWGMCVGLWWVSDVRVVSARCGCER